MTIKEKLKSFAMDNHIEKYAEHNAKQLEQIADYYAVEFAEWLQSSCYSLIEGNYVFRHNTFKTIELLEIFKKEKGL